MLFSLNHYSHLMHSYNITAEGLGFMGGYGNQNQGNQGGYGAKIYPIMGVVPKVESKDSVLPIEPEVLIF